ncbi:MAG TPA: DHH family phosphoesterase [Terriglobales bacterium]|nr:DHH family phosphoesterase [Terriglobales bacterium]
MPGYARLIRALRKTKVLLILGHQNSDPDAVCSAFAFMLLAKRINRKLKIEFASPDGVSKLSKQILKVIPLNVTETPDPSQADLIVTVDTNTLQQLGELKERVIESGKPLAMIDHHAPHPENMTTASMVICDERATSTCEMILSMYKAQKCRPNRIASQALLTGLIVETGHMSIATSHTFKATCTLIELGANPEEALRLTRPTMDESERIARLKASQRLRMERMGKWVVAFTEIGSYHASAARALIALGAHLAIVAGRRNDELTISLRSTREFNTETGIHLGTDLANPIGKALGGMGGGHATAAGANGKGEVNEAYKLLMRTTRNLIPQPTNANTESLGYAEPPSQTGVITQK